MKGQSTHLYLVISPLLTNHAQVHGVQSQIATFQTVVVAILFEFVLHFLRGIQRCNKDMNFHQTYRVDTVRILY
jgi:hypothetical protein